ncbi:MAG: hypothetical protein ACJ70Z_01365 [Nitrososphaera sp.]
MNPDQRLERGGFTISSASNPGHSAIIIVNINDDNNTNELGQIQRIFVCRPTTKHCSIGFKIR